LIRYFGGLGQPVTNLSQSYPWGLWMAFLVMCGAAFAGGGYVLAFIVYIMGVKKYQPVLRSAVLYSLVSYIICSMVLFVEFGRWWNIPNVFIGNGLGAGSVMFVLIWLFLLYIVTSALQFSPAFAEWIGNSKMKRTSSAIVVGAAAFGIAFSVLHQAGLGALLTMAKSKIHPLWYSELLPVMFFVSSIYAGLSMLIITGMLSGNTLMDEEHRNSDDEIVLGLARICGGAMFGYFALSILSGKFEGDFAFIRSSMGFWWLLEIIGFVAIPGLMFIHGAQKKNPVTVRAAAVIALLGVVLNRYNSVFLAYNWNLPFAEKYHPSFAEWVVAIAIASVLIWVFRWAVKRMPVMTKSPEWAVKIDKEWRG